MVSVLKTMKYQNQPSVVSSFPDDYTVPNKRVRIRVRGGLKKKWGEAFLRRKASSLGVRLKDIKHPSSTCINIEIVGGTLPLWSLVSWIKRSALFFKMDEVLIEFLD